MKKIVMDYIVYRQIKKSGLFDQIYYYSTYDDVRLADINPLWHYIKFGWKEGRNPSPNFNTNFYLGQNVDVKRAGINPLYHYVKYGLREKRLPVALLLDIPQPKIRNAEETPVKHYLDASIIVPVFNAIQFTKDCYSALCKTCGKLDVEFIFINNASTDGTSEWLDKIGSQDPRVTIIHNKENRGFSGAVNQGIVISSGKFIAIVNNDTIPGVGWLENLIETMNKDLSLGIVSPFTNYVGEGPQIDDDARNLAVREVDDYSRKIASKTGCILVSNRLVFFCVLIRRELIDLIGLLDEGYIRGNFEDDDYCMRAILAGYRLGIVKNSFVFHHGSASFKINKLDYVQHFEENRKLFFLKADRLSVAIPLKSKKSLTTPRVSVILRTVDRPRLLRNALNSLANQTRPHFEVVIVNDGGPDIPDVLEEYETYLNIHYLNNVVSKGRTAALNIGIHQAKGEWLCFLDDDDIFYPWFISTMLEAADGVSKSNFYYGQHTRVLIDPDEPRTIHSLVSMPPFTYERKALLVGNEIPINTWFVKRTTALDVGGFDETFDTLEDYDFILRFSEKNPFLLIPKVISEYRFYLSQQNTVSNSRSDVIAALSRIYNRYPSLDDEMEQAREAVLQRSLAQMEKIRELEKQIPDSSLAQQKQIYKDILKLVNAI